MNVNQAETIIITSSEMVSVDKKALKKILEALTGPGHLIRELQATRDLPPMRLSEGDELYENPINILLKQYNASCE
jgi:hypothetical protein